MRVSNTQARARIFNRRVLHAFLGSFISDQAPVVERADNFIQWINPYAADKMYSSQFILFGG